MVYREDNNYPKAFGATALILAALFAICYFITFSLPAPPPEGTGGILVNYGTTDEGSGSDYMSVEQPSEAEKANGNKPDKVNTAQPTPQVSADNSDKAVVTQNTEDAPTVVANDKKASPDLATQAKKSTSKPAINQNALYKGKTNNATGEGDGTGNTPGNQGKPTGTTLTNNYNGTGSGTGGNLTGMPQRSFVNKPAVTDAGRNTGKVVVDIRVDKQGNVTLFCTDKNCGYKSS